MSEGLNSIPLRLPLLCCLPCIWRHHHTTGTHLACLTSADILAALAISGERAMHGAKDFTPWNMTRQDEMQSTEVHLEMKSACPQLAPQLCMLERNLPHIQPERLISGQTCSPEAPGPGIKLAGNDGDVQCMRASMAAGSWWCQLAAGKTPTIAQATHSCSRRMNKLSRTTTAIKVCTRCYCLHLCPTYMHTDEDE